MRKTTGSVLKDSILGRTSALTRHKALWCALLVISAAVTHANEYTDAAGLFRGAGASSGFFDTAYGYAIFPTIGKGGIGVGGARGSGQVFVAGEQVGKTTMTQLSVGFQFGGQAFSQIIFFEDERAFDEFASGNFEFGATAAAVAITAGASASAGTTGAAAGVSGGKKDAATAGLGYHNGMAVFTIAKGGLMYEATIGGQKFSYEPA